MIKDKTAKHPIIISDFTSTDCIYPARHKLTGAAYIQNNGFAGCGISLYFIYLLVTTTNKIKQETCLTPLDTVEHMCYYQNNKQEFCL